MKISLLTIAISLVAIALGLSTLSLTACDRKGPTKVDQANSVTVSVNPRVVCVVVFFDDSSQPLGLYARIDIDVLNDSGAVVATGAITQPGSATSIDFSTIIIGSDIPRIFTADYSAKNGSGVEVGTNRSSPFVVPQNCP